MPGTFSAQARPRDGNARTETLCAIAFVRGRDFRSNPRAAQIGYATRLGRGKIGYSEATDYAGQRLIRRGFVFVEQFGWIRKAPTQKKLWFINHLGSHSVCNGAHCFQP